MIYTFFHPTQTISVSLDTEEEGLWGGHFPVRNYTTENLRGIPRFQQPFKKHEIPPTYLVDALVLEVGSQYVGDLGYSIEFF